MNSSNRFLKTLCLVLSCLILSNTVFAYTPETKFWEERKKSIELAMAVGPAKAGVKVPLFPAMAGPSLSGQLNSPVAGLKFFGQRELKPEFGFLTQLPAHLGTVRSISSSKHPHAPVILHIQDVHLNTEAQVNIGQAVRTLIADGKVDAIALEGAFGPLDLKEFQSYPNPEAVRMAGDFLLREKMITGPVWASLLGGLAAPPVIGVDDPALYEANVKAYRDSAGQVEKLKKQLAAFGRELAKNKAAFNPDLNSFDEMVVSHRENRASAGDYVARLLAEAERAGLSLPDLNLRTYLEAVRLEAALDERVVERDRSRLIAKLASSLSEEEMKDLSRATLGFRSGELRHTDFYGWLKSLCEKKGLSLRSTPAFDSYLRYVLLADSLNPEAMLKEQADHELAVYQALTHTDTERLHVKTARRLYLAGKLINFALTKEEWDEHTSLAHSPLTIDHGPNFSTFEKFYVVAEARDRAMADNLREIVSGGAKVVILVTGGFHAKGLLREFASHDTPPSTVSFVPRLTRIEKESGASYLSVFTQEKTPLEKLFRGEKLFLSPLQLPPETRFATEAGISASHIKLNGQTASSTGFLPVKSPFKKSGISRSALGSDGHVRLHAEIKGNAVEIIYVFASQPDGRLDIASCEVAPASAWERAKGWGKFLLSFFWLYMLPMPTDLLFGRLWVRRQISRLTGRPAMSHPIGDEPGLHFLTERVPGRPTVVLVHGVGPDLTDFSLLTERLKSSVNVAVIRYDDRADALSNAKALIRARKDSRLGGAKVLFGLYSGALFLHMLAVLMDDTGIFKGDAKPHLIAPPFGGSPRGMYATQWWVLPSVRFLDRTGLLKPKLHVARTFDPNGDLQKFLFRPDVLALYLKKMGTTPVSVVIDRDFNTPNGLWPYWFFLRLGLLKRKDRERYRQSYQRGLALSKLEDVIRLHKGRGFFWFLKHYTVLLEKKEMDRVAGSMRKYIVSSQPRIGRAKPSVVRPSRARAEMLWGPSSLLYHVTGSATAGLIGVFAEGMLISMAGHLLGPMLMAVWLLGFAGLHVFLEQFSSDARLNKSQPALSFIAHSIVFLFYLPFLHNTGFLILPLFVHVVSDALRLAPEIKTEWQRTIPNELVADIPQFVSPIAGSFPYIEPTDRDSLTGVEETLEPSLLAADSLLGRFGAGLGVNFYVPSSEFKEGFWKAELQLTFEERRVLNEKVLPIYQNGELHAPLPVEIVFHGSQPLLLLSRGLLFEQLPQRTQEAYRKSESGIGDRLEKARFSFGYTVFPAQRWKDAETIKNLSDWLLENDSNTVSFTDDLFQADPIRPEVVSFKGVFPSRTLSSQMFVRGIRPRPNALIYDIGTGTGVGALVAAKRSKGAARVIATDIQPLAVANARYNVSRSPHARTIEVLQADLLNIPDRPKDERATHIYANLPLPGMGINDPNVSDPDMSLLARLLRDARDRLLDDGTLEINYPEMPLFFLKVYLEGWEPVEISGTNLIRTHLPHRSRDYSRFVLMKQNKDPSTRNEMLRLRRAWIILSNLEVLYTRGDITKEYFHSELSQVSEAYKDDSTLNGRLVMKLVGELSQIGEARVTLAPVPDTRRKESGLELNRLSAKVAMGLTALMTLPLLIFLITQVTLPHMAFDSGGISAWAGVSLILMSISAMAILEAGSPLRREKGRAGGDGPSPSTASPNPLFGIQKQASLSLKEYLESRLGVNWEAIAQADIRSWISRLFEKRSKTILRVEAADLIRLEDLHALLFSDDETREARAFRESHNITQQAGEAARAKFAAALQEFKGARKPGKKRRSHKSLHNEIIESYRNLKSFKLLMTHFEAGADPARQYAFQDRVRDDLSRVAPGFRLRLIRSALLDLHQRENVRRIEVTEFSNGDITELASLAVALNQERGAKFKVGVLKGFRKPSLGSRGHYPEPVIAALERESWPSRWEEFQATAFARFQEQESSLKFPDTDQKEENFRALIYEVQRQAAAERPDGAQRVREMKLKLLHALYLRAEATYKIQTFSEYWDLLERRDPWLARVIVGMNLTHEKENTHPWTYTPLIRGAQQMGLKVSSEMGARWRGGDYLGALKRFHKELELDVTRIANTIVLGLPGSGNIWLSPAEQEEADRLQEKIFSTLQFRGITVEIHPTEQSIVAPVQADMGILVKRFLKNKIKVSLNPSLGTLGLGLQEEIARFWLDNPDLTYDQVNELMKVSEDVRFFESSGETLDRFKQELTRLLDVFRWSLALVVFGSARIHDTTHPDYSAARSLGRWAESAGVKVRTGAGPGIMQAVKEWIDQGVRIDLNSFEPPNTYVRVIWFFFHMCFRKIGLTDRSLGIVVFPGGFGTLDEVLEALLRDHSLVLYRTNYWKPIMDEFMREMSLEDRARLESRMAYADTPHEAWEKFQLFQNRQPTRRITRKMIIKAYQELKSGLPFFDGQKRVVTLFGGAHLSLLQRERLEEILRNLFRRGVAVKIGERGDGLETALGLARRMGQEHPDTDYFSLIQVVLSREDAAVEFSPLLSEFRDTYPRRVIIAGELTRSLLLNVGARGFLVLAGGLKTFHDLFDTVDVTQTKIVRRWPVILLGSEFWNPKKEIINQKMTGYTPPLISERDMKILTVLDHAPDVLKALRLWDENEVKGNGKKFWESWLKPMPPGSGRLNWGTVISAIAMVFFPFLAFGMVEPLSDQRVAEEQPEGTGVFHEQPPGKMKAGETSHVFYTTILERLNGSEIFDESQGLPENLVYALRQLQKSRFLSTDASYSGRDRADSIAGLMLMAGRTLFVQGASRISINLLSVNDHLQFEVSGEGVTLSADIVKRVRTFRPQAAGAASDPYDAFIQAVREESWIPGFREDGVFYFAVPSAGHLTARQLREFQDRVGAVFQSAAEGGDTKGVAGEDLLGLLPENSEDHQSFRAAFREVLELPRIPTLEIIKHTANAHMLNGPERQTLYWLMGMESALVENGVMAVSNGPAMATEKGPLRMHTHMFNFLPLMGVVFLPFIGLGIFEQRLLLIVGGIFTVWFIHWLRHSDWTPVNPVNGGSVTTKAPTFSKGEATKTMPPVEDDAIRVANSVNAALRGTILNIGVDSTQLVSAHAKGRDMLVFLEPGIEQETLAQFIQSAGPANSLRFAVHPDEAGRIGIMVEGGRWMTPVSVVAWDKRAVDNGVIRLSGIPLLLNDNRENNLSNLMLVVPQSLAVEPTGAEALPGYADIKILLIDTLLGKGWITNIPHLLILQKITVDRLAAQQA